jgi:hypothetical protein
MLFGESCRGITKHATPWKVVIEQAKFAGRAEGNSSRRRPNTLNSSHPLYASLPHALMQRFTAAHDPV